MAEQQAHLNTQTSPERPPADRLRPNVVVAVASTGQIHEQSLASIQAMIRTTQLAESVEMWWQNSSPVGLCRNQLVERFLADSNKTHLLFVDTDMVVPDRGLDALLALGIPLSCGPAPITRSSAGTDNEDRSPYDLTTNIMDATDPAARGLPLDPESTGTGCRNRPPDEFPEIPFPCDTTGLSFCLIAREVIERMKPPWFTFVYPPNHKTIGEDVYFFRKAGQSGYRVVVHPEVWCDHVKPANLTHLEQLLGEPATDPHWTPKPVKPIPRTLVLACTRNSWASLRTAEILIRWQEEADDRIGVRMFGENHVGRALGRWIYEEGNKDTTDTDVWDRVLLLGPDIVPCENLIELLATVDAPIVSPIYRTIRDGQIVYSFGLRDPISGRVDFPMDLSGQKLSRPFPAQAIDLNCCLIQRDMCRHAIPALQFAATEPGRPRAFDEHFCDLVRSATGADPMVAPVCVEHWHDVGLLGLLRLKQSLQADRTLPRPKPVTSDSAPRDTIPRTVTVRRGTAHAHLFRGGPGGPSSPGSNGDPLAI